jgi:hypothetical protein
MLISMNLTVESKIKDVLDHRTGLESFVENQTVTQSNNI